MYSRLKLVPATVLLLLSGALACNVHSQCATQTACCSGFGGKGVIAALHCTSSGDEVQCEAVVKVSRYPAQTGPWPAAHMQPRDRSSSGIDYWRLPYRLGLMYPSLDDANLRLQLTRIGT